MMPDKVKIGGITYPVSFNKDNELICGNLDGEIRYTTPEIVLKSTLTGDYKEQVFLHEVIHGTFNAMGRSDLRIDEVLVESLSQMLYQVLKDNKISF